MWSIFQCDPYLGLGGVHAQTPPLSVVVFVPQCAEPSEPPVHPDGLSEQFHCEIVLWFCSLPGHLSRDAVNGFVEVIPDAGMCCNEDIMGTIHSPKQRCLSCAASSCGSRRV